MVVKKIDGQLIECPMAENIVHVTPKGITHILVPLDDAILYEWGRALSIRSHAPAYSKSTLKQGTGPLIRSLSYQN